MQRAIRVYVGRYILFGSPVCVYGVAGEDGEGRTGWTKTSYLTVEVGMDGDWRHTLETALHEVTEFSMILAQCGHRQLQFLERKDCQSYTYHMSHDQFTVVMQNVADVMQYLLPDLSAAYHDWKRGRKKDLS